MTAILGTAASRATWGFLWFVSGFIVYGSLFPFDFLSTPKPLDQLLQWQFPGNIPDATDNFFLFIPLGIALQGCFRGRGKLLIASVIALLLLGLGVQWIQLYLPTRTASLIDVAWNGMGLAVGLAIAIPLRHIFLNKADVNKAATDRFAILLVLIWLFYESFPFVPTLDIGELRAHLKSAVFAPPFEVMRFTQHLLAATMAGFALQRSGLSGRSARGVITLATLAVILEVFVAYGGLRRETLLGMTLGLVLGHLIGKKHPVGASLTIAATAIGTLLLTILTPYRGQVSDGGFTFTPFSSIFWQGVLKDLPPLAFETLAIATLIWVGLQTNGWPHRQPRLWLGLVTVMMAALELVRVGVMGFHADTTLLLLTLVVGPFALAYQANPTAVKQVMPITQTPELSTWALPAGWLHAITFCGLAAAIYATFRLPGMPYNVRELLPSGFSGLVSAIGFATIVYLLANSPFLLIRGSRSKQFLMLFPLLLLVQGVLVWFLLRQFAPLESIHDIVGSPTLGWPWDWEIMLRFIALHQAVAMQIVGATLIVATVQQAKRLPSLLYWLSINLLLAWPLYIFNVAWAATDNLVELIRDNASFLSCSFIAVGILMTSTTGFALGAALSNQQRRIALIALAGLGGIAATGAFYAGLESMLVKYDQAFSAAQFLLSPDRQHYLTGSALVSRFSLVYVVISAVLAILVAGQWRVFSQQK